ncbi:ankyrin repeat domain-containing protein [Heliorestis convoluta]|uniref:BIG2 domain-containing protein n=1 Tax=Heliorestis convoluta TaxID=356322 RepID=A0A5Q2MX37_9FIRM|nr:ankyrin repeat domain-containing protein [Heliorestis convoluta]QGG47118.1 hypothetical protein FTV88_0966 [Heliorestis convoluta]
MRRLTALVTSVSLLLFSLLPVAEARWKEGDLLPERVFASAQSLSAGQVLEIEGGKNLFFSNAPEMPTMPGILARADNVISKSGEVRILYSHFNMLIDYSTSKPVNVPAQIGVYFVNDTSRSLDIYYKRLGKGVSKTVDGKMLYIEDRAPQRPGIDTALYYGTELGNKVVADFFASYRQQERLFATVAPGQIAWLSDQVGPLGWAIGMGDFVFRDSHTKEVITLQSLRPGEAVGVRSFIARHSFDLRDFFRDKNNPASVLTLGAGEHLHMRGLFADSISANGVHVEGVSRRKTFTYDSYDDGPQSITVGAHYRMQHLEPAREHYVPTIFANDILRNGVDSYGYVQNGQAVAVKAMNNGSYGTDYDFTFQITGPTVIALQEAKPLHADGSKPFVDMYNQFLTVMLDDDPSQIRTLHFKDPNYHLYYSNFERLQPLGKVKVAYVLDDVGTRNHRLRVMLPPNSYGPFQILLLPLEENQKRPVTVSSLTIEPKEVRILLDDQGKSDPITIAVKITPENAISKLNWSSSRPDIVTINKDGMVQAHAVGEAIITATTEDGKHQSSSRISVESKVLPAESIQLDREQINLAVGGVAQKIRAIILPQEAPQNVSWSSSNEKIATVDQEGTITGHSIGVATITATTADKALQATAQVTVHTPVRDSDFLRALERGSYEEFVTLLEKGANVNARDSQGNSALIKAVLQKDLRKAKALLASGADPAQKNSEAMTALMLAAQLNQSEMVKALLTAQADVNQKNEKMGEWTALFSAVWAGNLDITKILLEAGANPNVRYYEAGKRKEDGWTPLNWAVSQNNLEMTQLLLSRGADPSQRTDGWTALMNASWYGRMDLATVLLQAGARE